MASVHTKSDCRQEPGKPRENQESDVQDKTNTDVTKYGSH